MSARRVALAFGSAVLVASGGYVFVYLVRWEWNRALFCAALFVATEVAIVGALVLERMRQLSEQIRRAGLAPHTQPPSALVRLRETRPAPHVGFEWLAPDVSTTNVFVPILMGAGVVLSALAWVVERVARGTAGTAMEHRLADSLAAIALPDGGFLDPAPPPDARAIELLAGPRAR